MGRTVGDRKNPTMDERDSDRQTNGWLRCCGIAILVIFAISCIIGLPLWSQLVNCVINPRPGDIKIAVTGASLTDVDEFNNYNLDLNITLRNPYKPFRVYYDKALLVADYRNKAAMASIAGFHQPPKHTTFRTLSFKLQRDNNIADDAAAADILVRLDLTVNKFKSVTWSRFSYSGRNCSPARFTCHLKDVPYSQNGSQSATTAFNPTKCYSYTDSYHC
ncbi:hypothetical protein ACLB2K_061236 [Fragaria x ananassa]